MIFLGNPLATAVRITPMHPRNNGTILYVGGEGPGNYTTIQAAIDNATAGDTILVYPHHYPEFLTITKQLAIRGIAENRTLPAISNESEWVVNIQADGCLFENFNITADYPGGILLHADHATISNCTINQANTGLSLDNASDNLVENNTLNEEFKNGIYLYASSRNIIKGNSISSDRAWGGIVLHNASDNNLIKDNDCSKTYRTSIENVQGATANSFIGNHLLGEILVDSGSNHIIKENNFTGGIDLAGSLAEMLSDTLEGNVQNGKPICFLKNQQNFTVENVAEAILVNCSHGTVQDSTMGSTPVGVLLTYCNNITCTKNTITNCWDGFRLSSCQDITVVDNVVKDWAYGIHASYCERAQLLRNTFTSGSSAGIGLRYCSGCIVRSNSITNSWFGIDLEHVNTTNVSGNIITIMQRYGIMGDEIRNTKFFANHCTICKEGITVYRALRLTFIGNHFSVNEIGLDLQECSLCWISRNEFRLNTKAGLLLISAFDGITAGNMVTHNNFGLNTLDATFDQAYLTFWWGNYWGRPYVGPKIIPGLLLSFGDYVPVFVPWLNVDLHPRSTPNLILPREASVLV